MTRVSWPERTHHENKPNSEIKPLIAVQRNRYWSLLFDVIVVLVSNKHPCRGCDSFQLGCGIHAKGLVWQVIIILDILHTLFLTTYISTFLCVCVLLLIHLLFPLFIFSIKLPTISDCAPSQINAKVCPFYYSYPMHHFISLRICMESSIY